MGAHVPQHFQGVPLRDVSQHPHAQTGACTAHQRGLPAGLHWQGPTGPSHLYPIHPIPYILAGLVDQSHPVTAAPRPEPGQCGTPTLAVPSVLRASETETEACSRKHTASSRRLEREAARIRKGHNRDGAGGLVVSWVERSA